MQVPTQRTGPLVPTSVVDQKDRKSHTTTDLIYEFLARYEIVFLILLFALFIAFAALASHYKRLWYDELFTVIVATQPTWHGFAQAMPPEGNPPINTLLTRLSIHIFGLTEFSVRLPPLLGFAGALAGLYIFVRRECGAVFGLLAVALVLCEPAWQYSYEARPYGILLGFLMLALVSWQSATRAADATPQRPRVLALVGMVVGIAGSILSHHIGVAEVGIPLLFGEVVRTYTRRRADWPLYATGLSALPALAITLPMMRRTNAVVIAHSPLLTPPITPHKIVTYFVWVKDSLPLVLDPRILVFLAAVIFATWALGFLRRSRRTEGPGTAVTQTRKIPPHMISAALGTLLLIPITALAMMPARGWFFSRYGIGSVAGVAVVTCFYFAARGVKQRALVILLLAGCTLIYVRGFVRGFRTPAHATLADSLIYDDKSNLPIVISDPLSYPTLWWYAPASMKRRIVYLEDPPVPKTFGFPLVEAALLAEKPFISAPMLDYGTFMSTQELFLLPNLGKTTANLKGGLEASGYRATSVRTAGAGQLYEMRRDPGAEAKH